jgi:6-phosphogluconolactonase
MNIEIFNEISSISRWFLEKLLNLTLDKNNKFNLVLSGGNTPKAIYEFISVSVVRYLLEWEKIHIWFADERCVPPDQAESNFFMTKKYFLNNIDIPENNIHRIMSEYDPETACAKYHQEILENVSMKNGFPCFDWILLGLGEDGHTASIFFNSQSMFDSNKYCEVTQNPYSKQTRITLTPKIINNANLISFLVTGSNKARIIEDIIKGKDDLFYPAKLIKPTYGMLEWILDKEAANCFEKESHNWKP